MGQGVVDHPEQYAARSRRPAGDIPLEAEKVAAVYAGYENLKARNEIRML